MSLEVNPKHRQEVPESFDRHVKNIVDGSITNVQMELTPLPLMFHNEHPIMIREKTTFTYEGYTQAGKRFSLTIDE